MPRPIHSPSRLLVALIILFAASPLIDDLPGGMILEGVLVGIALFAALAVTTSGPRLAAGAVAVTIAVGCKIAGVLHPEAMLSHFSNVPAALFVVYVILRLLGYVLATTRVDGETLCASISGFLLLGLLWAMLYTLVESVVPGSFALEQPGQRLAGFNAFYFSFITLSTIGYGDIVPVSKFARMLAVMQAITGMFYVAVLIARIVSIHSSNAQNQRGSGDGN